LQNKIHIAPTYSTKQDLKLCDSTSLNLDLRLLDDLLSFKIIEIDDFVIKINTYYSFYYFILKNGF